MVSIYLAFYLVFLVGIYILGFYIIKEKSFQWSSFIRLILALIVTLAVIFPFYHPYLKYKKENFGLARSIELIQLSASTPRDFFSIDPDNKLYNFLAKKEIFSLPKQTDGSKRLFFGFSALVLGLIGLLRKDKLKWIFLAVVLWAAILALGPYYRDLKMPYFYLYHFLPGFDSLNFPGRATNLLIFGISALAGFGIWVILERMKKKWQKVLSGGIIFALVFLEIFSPPISFAKVKTKKEFAPVYYWLAEQPEDFAIIELPFWSGFENERMYYSTLHWKKLVGGFSSFFPLYTVNMIEIFKRFPAPESLPAIKNSGAKYLIVHLAEYPEDLREYLKKNTQPFKIFGDDYVYLLSP